MPRTWTPLTIAIAVAALCGPLLTHSSLPLGSDVYAHTHWLRGFMESFSEGHPYPRWTDRTNQGLGAPAFVMFPPLVYYGAGAVSWLTGSIVSGFKLYLLLVAVLTGGAFYALAREWIGPGLPAALAAGVYLLLPYHVLDMYQRFALSEITSFIFFPLILLHLRRAMERTRGSDTLGLCLAYAGLIYTHIVSALMFSLFVGVWMVWEGWGQWRRLLHPAAALACGVALAAPALLPAAVEKTHANVAWLREMPSGDYRINFIFRDEVLPALGFKDPVKPPVMRSALSQLTLAGLAAVLALTWSSALTHRGRRDVLALASGCAAAYVLQLEVSTPVWRLVPELATIQFPWRFQTLMVLTAALLCGFAFFAGWGDRRVKEPRKLVGPAAIALGLVVAVNLMLAYQNAHLKSFRFSEETSRSQGVTDWVEPAFTPVQFRRYRDLHKLSVDIPRASFIEGSGAIEIAAWESSARRLEISSPNGGRVRVRSFWFPGWAGTLGERPLELAPSEDEGLLTFRVPAGVHTVRLSFTATTVRRAAGWIGLGSLPLTALVAWRPPRVMADLAGPASRPAPGALT